MLKLVSFKICPFVQRITATLHAKGIPFEIEYISLKSKPQWFLDISPNGQVPVLITTENVALFESEAIVEYLEEVYPAFHPHLAATEKALNRAWGYLGAKQYMVQCGAQTSSDAATFEQRIGKLKSAFAKVEAVLGGRQFFNSDTIGTVDLAWLPVLHRAKLIEQFTGYNLLAEFPKIQQWQENVLATGLSEQSVSDDFEQKFCDFYLSSQTYLGQLNLGTRTGACAAATQSCCDNAANHSSQSTQQHSCCG